MEAKVTINGKLAVLRGREDERLRDVLYREGYTSVRDSDDAEGFAGSDTIVLDSAACVEEQHISPDLQQ